MGAAFHPSAEWTAEERLTLIARLAALLVANAKLGHVAAPGEPTIETILALAVAAPAELEKARDVLQSFMQTPAQNNAPPG